MKKLSLLLAITLSTSIFAQTEFSKFLKYVQTTYADTYQGHPILIWDMDEIEYRYASAGVFGDTKELERERAKIIQVYVKEKVGVDLEMTEALGLELYTTKLKEGAYALPTLKDIGRPKKGYKLCSVFPAAANSNQRLETERITGLTTPGAYDDVTYEGLQEKMTYSQMQAFSVYHELGHCVDRTYMPRNYLIFDIDAHTIHESEVFAETFGLLMLEKEGITGTGRTRALLRNMYTVKMGKWFINNPQNGFGNPAYRQGGLIYYLTPGLLAANEYVKRKRRELQENDMEFAMTKAAEFTDKHALHGRSFHAIQMSMEQGIEATVDQYRDWAFDSPGFFRDSYRDLLRFIDFSPFMLEKIVGDTPNIDEGASVDLTILDQVCSIETQSKLNDFIEVQRGVLENSDLSYEAQKSLREALNNIFVKYSECSK